MGKFLLEGADTMLSGGYIAFRHWRINNQHGTLGRDLQPSVFSKSLRPTDDRQSVARLDLPRVRPMPGKGPGLNLRLCIVLNHLQLLPMGMGLFFSYFS